MCISYGNTVSFFINVYIILERVFLQCSAYCVSCFESLSPVFEIVPQQLSKKTSKKLRNLMAHGPEDNHNMRSFLWFKVICHLNVCI